MVALYQRQSSWQYEVVNAMETFACEGWTEVETFLTMLEELKQKCSLDCTSIEQLDIRGKLTVKCFD